VAADGDVGLRPAVAPGLRLAAGRVSLKAGAKLDIASVLSEGHQVLELTQAPATEAIAAMQAILKAGMFFVRGTGPHLNYDTRPAIDHLLS
jgi:hypothetical protein